MASESARMLHGAGLSLRPLQAADEPLYVGLFTSSVVMAGIGPPRTVDDARAAFVRACTYNVGPTPGHRVWIACADGDDLGIVALVREGASAELGIMFRPWAATGRHARESLAVVIEHAFGELGLGRITAESAAGARARLSERLLRPYPFRRHAAAPERAAWALDIADWRLAACRAADADVA